MIDELYIVLIKTIQDRGNLPRFDILHNQCSSLLERKVVFLLMLLEHLPMHLPSRLVEILICQLAVLHMELQNMNLH